MTYRLILTITLSYLLSVASGQNAIPQIIEVSSELVGEAKGVAYNETLGQGIDTFSLTVKVMLEDTANLSKLYFEMIDKANNSIYISQEYNLQTNTISGSRPNATAALMGNECVVMLGHYWSLLNYKIKVRAQYINGALSAYTEY